MKKYILLVLALLFLKVPPVYGEQKFNVSSGDVVKIKLSSRELTRIAVENGRIDKLWGASGILESQVDKKEGEIFLRPSSGASHVFSFFVRDNFGSTYTIIAEQIDIPSQTVILVPNSKVSRVDKEKYKNRSLVVKIKDLIKAMANPEANLDKVQSQERHELIQLWKESRITLIKTYQMDTLKGETFSFKNISHQEMQVVENEFLNLRPNILAVSLEKLTLKPDEETRLYIVRRGE